MRKRRSLFLILTFVFHSALSAGYGEYADASAMICRTILAQDGASGGTAKGKGANFEIFCKPTKSGVDVTVFGVALSNELLLGGIFPIFVPIAMAL